MQKKIKVLAKTLCLLFMISLIGSSIPASKASAADRVLTYGDFKYSVDGKEVCIKSYRGNSTKLVFPDKMKGIKVTDIRMDSRGLAALSKVREVTRGQYVDYATILDTSDRDKWKSLSKITVKSGNKKYCSEDGVLFWKAGQKKWLLNFPVSKQTQNGKYSIPKGVEMILEGALEGCKTIKEIHIPASLTKEINFSGCKSLKTIKVSPSNRKYASKSGSLYDKKMKKLLKCPNQMSMQYKFPKSVTTIGVLAFNGNTNLREITIPKQIIKVYEWAFEGCSNLKTIRFKNKLKMISPALFPETPVRSLIIEDNRTELKVHEGDVHGGDQCIPGSGCIKKMFQRGLGKGTIYCRKGSKAEKTALKYNLRISYIK